MGSTVVFLIDELEVWGGTETHLRRLLGRLDPARFRPVVAVVGRSRLAAELERDGVAVVPLSIHRTFALSGLAGLAKIALLLRRERASLLVTYHTAADLLGPLPARALGVPVLSCRRDDGFTKKPIHVRVQRAVNLLIGGMVSVSHAVADVVARSEGFARERIQVIWNGEDLAAFAPGPSTLRSELGVPESDCVVTAVGSLTPVKDHRTQLAAFALVAARHPAARLLIVGDGPLRPELEALARSSGGARVRFLGHRADVPAVLRASDVYVQTSLTEGFSNAILQAMACGLPVVATAVGGNPELVTADAGTLLPPRDARAIGEAIGALVADPARRRSMGRAARRRVEASGSIAAMAAAYSDAFERAVEGRFPGPSSRK
jgi:glycosyltransferase involved in cell wall biosynthesis